MLVASISLVALLLGSTVYYYTSVQHKVDNQDILFQTSTINILLEGVYDGNVTFKELRMHGDFGLGTFNSLDGEMIELNGEFYQIKTDGIAYLVNESMQTPFSVVTFFESDNEVLLKESLNYTEMELYLDDLLPTENIFYAIKIEGTFDYIKARSVPKQYEPYPQLAEAVKNQSIFEFHNIEGTIVGFRSPDYISGVNVPGYHLHFLTEDKKAGGHVLECRMENVEIDIDYTSNFYMVLPENDEFYELDLAKEKQKELEKVER